MIVREVNAAAKEKNLTEFSTSSEDSLDDILSKSFFKAQCSIQSVFYNVAEQVLLELLRKYVIEKMLDAYIAKLLETNGAAEGLRKRLLACSFSMARSVNFHRRKTDAATKEKEYTTA